MSYLVLIKRQAFARSLSWLLVCGKCFPNYYSNPCWCIGVGVSCNFRHIYWHNLLWQMLSHITIRLRLCLDTVADVFATTFGRLFFVCCGIFKPTYVMADVIAIYYGWCYCHIWVFVVDVITIVDTLVSHLIVSKVGRCCCLEFFFMWQMLLP